MTVTQLESNINARIQAIQPIVNGQTINVAASVSKILAEEVAAFVSDITITVTVPSGIPVVDDQTSESRTITASVSYE